MKGQIGPFEAKGRIASTGFEGTITFGANGIKPHGAATATAVSGSIRLGSREAEATLGSCSTDSGCTAVSVGIHGVSAASNTDLGFKAEIGIEVGATLHVGEAITAFAGAAKFAYELFAADVRQQFFPTSKNPQNPQ